MASYHTDAPVDPAAAEPKRKPGALEAVAVWMGLSAAYGIWEGEFLLGTMIACFGALCLLLGQLYRRGRDAA